MFGGACLLIIREDIIFIIKIYYYLMNFARSERERARAQCTLPPLPVPLTTLGLLGITPYPKIDQRHDSVVIILRPLKFKIDTKRTMIDTRDIFNRAGRHRAVGTFN